MSPLTFVGANRADENTEPAVRYGILSMAGKPVLTLVGARPRRRLEQELAAVI